MWKQQTPESDAMIDHPALNDLNLKAPRFKNFHRQTYADGAVWWVIHSSVWNMHNWWSTVASEELKPFFIESVKRKGKAWKRTAKRGQVKWERCCGSREWSGFPQSSFIRVLNYAMETSSFVTSGSWMFNSSMSGDCFYIDELPSKTEKMKRLPKYLGKLKIKLAVIEQSNLKEKWVRKLWGSFPGTAWRTACLHR